MKKLFLFLFLSIFIFACSALQETARPNQRANEENNRQTAVTATISPIPTPSIDYQATIVAHESTARAVQDLQIQATANEADRIQEQLSWTATIDMSTIQASGLTQQSDIATSTAALTYAPITATAQVAQATLQIEEFHFSQTQLAATQQAPTLIIQIEQAQVDKEFARANAIIDAVLRIVMGFCIFVITLIMCIVVFSRTYKKESAQDESEEAENIPTLPLAKTSETVGGTTWLRAEVPCPNNVLLELAEGIINRRMTLAFNAWEGTEVHKHLKRIREFMSDHGFAKNIKNSNGMMDVLAKGEQFLLDTLAKGEPPKPFVCVE